MHRNSSLANCKRLDSYSMLICSKYLKKEDDYINIICVCKKFKETTEKLRYNPIPINSLKLFPKIQTQYLYSSYDVKITGMHKYKVNYDANYNEYLNYKKVGIKCQHIKYTQENRWKYGDNIPNEVNILDTNCYNSLKIKAITIPNGITSIRDNCFEMCKLTNVVLPIKLTKINDYCFRSCFSLISITIPSLIQSIGNGCFWGCHSLQAIEIPQSTTRLGCCCFSHCIRIATITLPSSLKHIGKECFSYCRILTSVQGNIRLKIDDTWFEHCDKLKTKPNVITQHIN
ncbi:hypothetical protein QTN25_001935 [Entamoeba marina]